MDPQAPNIPVVETYVTPEIPKEIKTNKSNGITIFSMALFVLMSLTVIIFLYYQNQQLKDIVANYQTPEVSPTPVATTDPTANWKTYTDEKQGIEFKYPNDWYASSYKSATFGVFLDAVPVKIPEASEFVTPIFVGFNEVTDTVTGQKSYQEKTLSEGVKRFKELIDIQTVKVVEDLLIGGKKATQISGNLGPGMMEGEYLKYTLIQMDNKLLIVQLSGERYQGTYDQILSAFKFISTSPSPMPKTTPVSTSSALPVTY